MTTWDLYYSSLVAFSLHPGYLREGAIRPTLEELAKMADEMLIIREQRKWQ